MPDVNMWRRQSYRKDLHYWILLERTEFLFVFLLSPLEPPEYPLLNVYEYEGTFSHKSINTKLGLYYILNVNIRISIIMPSMFLAIQ